MEIVINSKRTSSTPTRVGQLFKTSKSPQLMLVQSPSRGSGNKIFLYYIYTNPNSQTEKLAGRIQYDSDFRKWVGYHNGIDIVYENTPQAAMERFMKRVYK